MSNNPRLLAVEILQQFFTTQQSLTHLIEKNMVNRAKQSETRETSNLTQELCYGVVRWYEQLAAIAEHLLSKPLKAKDDDIYIVILLGLYQLKFLRIPPHAAINETVELAVLLKKDWAKGLINAILREYQRSEEKLIDVIKDDDCAYYSHPEWLLNKLQTNWPNNWQAIAEANNQRPPFTLRVNLQKNTRENYLKKLNDLEIPATAGLHSPAAITLESPLNVDQLPGFREGWISVQDEAAQLAGYLLDLKPGQRVLDACAAPGGKTGHIFEIESQLKEVVAIDCDAKRLARVTENLERLQYQANLICADANRSDEWWDGELFDRILIDAPCSATGVIRRHPDIKYLRRPEDFNQLHQQQLHLLNHLWSLLKPNGLLVYVTCSIFPDENLKTAEMFQTQHKDAEHTLINAPWGIEQSIGRQILSGTNNMDGFYYARWKKIS